jgi:hypothetical protein
MKKRNSIICVLLVIAMAVCGQANAKSMDDVVGTYYNMKFKDKYWIQGEGTLRDNNTGVGVIKANKKWTLNRNTNEGKVMKYNGKCRVKGNKFIVKKTKVLRDQLEKKALKRWLKLYVEDQGETITNMKFSYSKYKITKAKIKSGGPVSLKIILQGTLSGNVSGGVGKVVRQFKYEAKVIFGNRTAP